jgi:hypothetical protein
VPLIAGADDYSPGFWSGVRALSPRIPKFVYPVGQIDGGSVGQQVAANLPSTPNWSEIHFSSPF